MYYDHSTCMYLGGLKIGFEGLTRGTIVTLFVTLSCAPHARFCWVTNALPPVPTPRYFLICEAWLGHNSLTPPSNCDPVSERLKPSGIA